ncbi:predicted protein [Chaetoceros tenuissimus]|uniref:Uncharacterized protein n=1 Tax=Chaetoceros tenuissimus TaxID=426638 RepID=A0AAD3H5S8_9STRA|nr:predicted protein [Chaetoceros tenuissimus]
MENSERSRAEDLLHKILHNIACKDEAEQITYYQVYPLNTSPRTQHVPKVYKNHLAGLFYKLGLLQVNNKSQIRKKHVEKWNAFCLDKPYKFNEVQIEKVRIIDLVIDKEMICASQERPITDEEYAFLNQCRNEFLSSTKTNDDTNANVSVDTDTNTTEASNKRPISPEPDDTEPKRTRE